jgi:hypothetical protein
VVGVVDEHGGQTSQHSSGRERLDFEVAADSPGAEDAGDGDEAGGDGIAG